MAEVKVLIQGYVNEKDGAEFASSTTTLIKDGKLNIIVDPGMDRSRLLTTLKKENLATGDINYVVLTHYHLDHSLLAGIFENAKVLDRNEIYSWDGKIVNHGGIIPETDIKIIRTPGHDVFHCAVIVKTEELGCVVIAGDVFWWMDDAKQETDNKGLLEHKDPYVKNEQQLAESRKKILEIANYIIPGHGKMFKVIG